MMMMNPFTKQMVAMPTSMGRGGRVATAKELLEVFGTEHPSRAAIEANPDAVTKVVGRGSAICVVSWSGEKPDGRFFYGITGD